MRGPWWRQENGQELLKPLATSSAIRAITIELASIQPGLDDRLEQVAQDGALARLDIYFCHHAWANF